MDTKKKEEELLNVIQSLCKVCDDISQGLTSEQRNMLNAVNNAVLDARVAVSAVLIQDKEDGLMLNAYSMSLDFLAENGLITNFIKHVNKI